MKFQDLYNRVYLTEQEDEKDLDRKEGSAANTVAMPEDFDVEGVPLPEPSAESDEQPMEGEEEGEQVSESRPSTLKDYIFKLEDFADTMNGIEGDSLQSLVARIDKPLTPFEGISSRTKTDIVRVAETLRSLSETLKLFIIGSAKK